MSSYTAMLNASDSSSAGFVLPARDTVFGVLVAIAFLVIGVLRIIPHAMWRDEHQAWMLAVYSPTLPDLFYNLRYEGHPGLWHVLLWMVSRVTTDASAMKLLHIAIATLAVYLFAAHAPFSRLIRGLFSIGYFAFYEYAVISRNYALGLMLVILFCVLLTRRSSPLWMGMNLFLLAQANFFCTLLTLALSFAWLLNLIAEHRAGVAVKWGKNVLGGTAAALGVALAVIQVIPPADTGYAEAWQFKLDVARAGKVAATPYRAYIPIPFPSSEFWSSNILDGTAERGAGEAVRKITPGLMAQPLLSVVFVGLFMWSMRKSPLALTFFTVATLGLMAFMYAKYLGSLRHHGHLFIILTAACWMASCGAGSAANKVGEKLRTSLFTLVLIAQAIGGLFGAAIETRVPFSASEAAARYIRETLPADMPIAGHVDVAASSIAGYLDRTIYYPSHNTNGRFMVWSRTRELIGSDTAIARVREFCQQQHRDVLYVSSVPLTEVPIDFTLLRSFIDSIRADERFWVYRVSPH